MKTSPILTFMCTVSMILLVTDVLSQVKIGSNPELKDPSSVLELEKTDMGLLIPRVSLSDVFDQTRWVRLVSSIEGPYGDVWIDGNNNILSANSANQNLLGEHNVVLGYRAFADDAGTSGNMIAIGEGAAEHDTTAGDARNIAIGYQAADSNVASNVNALGSQAAYWNTQWGLNALGRLAAAKNEGWSVNALGESAAELNTGPHLNALGYHAARNNTGENVNAFGSSAAQNNQGEHVNAIGQSAAANNTGSHVIAMAYEAAYSNNGNDAVAIGQQALKGNGTMPEGNGNIGIGYQAGMNIGAGSNNIAIGYNTQFLDGYEDDQINIGNNIIRDANGVIQLKDLIQLTPTTTPASPLAGMIYFDSGDNTLYCYDGTTWQALW